MSAPFRAYEPDQTFLFPQSPREWLPADHLAFFVMDVVASLDLREILRHYDFKPVVDEHGRVVGESVKSGRGQPAYDPRMMTALLVYAYVTGTPCSRQIEKKCLEDVAFRVVSANQKPDHSTMAEFRKVHLKALAGLFLQVLKLCQKTGLVKLGHVALDGTKVKANASKHKAMSYGRMLQREEELKQEIAELLKRAEETDHAEDETYGKGKRGDELSQELAWRETRLVKIQEAKAAVDHEHQVIVACEVTNPAADAPHLSSMVEQIETNTGERPKDLSADAGYFSDQNVKGLETEGIDPYIAAERFKHGERPPEPQGPIPPDASRKEQMIRKLRTVAGRAAYALRKVTVEPVFGQIRTRGLVRFWMRGLQKVRDEWALWCTGHNLLKLFRNGGLIPCTTQERRRASSPVSGP